MNRKNIFLLIVFLFVVAVSGTGIYYFSFLKKENTAITNQPTKNQEKEIKGSPCLANDEWSEKYRPEPQYPEDYKKPPKLLYIYVRDRETGKQKFSFTVDNVDYNQPFTGSIEIHKCGVYILREFNYDYEVGKVMPNYRSELWKYDFSGNGTRFLVLSDGVNKDEVSYSNVFQVNDTEEYVALIRYHKLPSPRDLEEELVIKSLVDGRDLFALKMGEIMQKYKIEGGGYMGLAGWHNGHFRFTISESMEPNIASLLIDSKTWQIVDVAH